MKVVVSAKGQVTIPKELRESLGIGEGQVLDFIEEKGRLVDRKIFEEDPVDAVYGILKQEGSTYELIAELRGEFEDL